MCAAAKNPAFSMLQRNHHDDDVERSTADRRTDVRRPRSLWFWLAAAVLLVAASLTYGLRHGEPRSLFWDENYHIASAHKQLAGVMYMEAHPPLGKMLIALGERLVGANDGLDTTALLGRDHVENRHLPEGYRYTGVRLPSVLAMIASVWLMYLILWRLTGSVTVAFVFGALLAFDNALVVHGRAAMLEGMQIGFALLAIYVLVAATQGPGPVRLWRYAALAAAIGLAIMVKLNAAVLLLLPVALFVFDRWPALCRGEWWQVLRRLGSAAIVSVVSLAAVVLAVFYLHIATGTHTHENRFYKASLEYRTHLRAGTASSLSGFRAGLRDHLRYIAEYAEGVPRLDLCKPGENGSTASSWPFGGRAINYRWQREVVDSTPKVGYTYLIGNPLIWASVLLGLVLSVSLVLGRVVYGLAVHDRRLFGWIVLSTSLYLAYMLAIAQIGRVMYLYHYLLPLVFGVLNLALVCRYVFDAGLARHRWHARANLLAFLLLVIAVFVFFAPLTYGTPLAADEFARRQWFEFWRLEPVR